LFTPEQVQAAGPLKCPVCGQVFVFRAGASPAASQRPRSHKPIGKAVPAPAELVAKKPLRRRTLFGIPLARPVAVPKTEGTAPAAQMGPFDSPALDMGAGAGPLVQPPYRYASAARRRVLPVVITALAVLLLIGAVVILRDLLGSGDGSSTVSTTRVLIGTARNQKNSDEKAFKLTLANQAWAPDGILRKRLGAVTAWKSVDKDREDWFAVAVRDYGFVRPRQAELVRAGMEKLEEHFEGTLELAEKAEPTKLGEAAGQRLLFRGQLNAVNWWGHMYMAHHHGFGYWVYVAAPTKQEANELFARELQGADRGFALLTERAGWREQPPKMSTFATEGGDLTVTVPEGLFVKFPAKDQDDRGQLHLFAKFQIEPDNRKNADVLILALEKQESLKEAMQSAKKYLEEKKQEENKDYKLESAADGGAVAELGVATPVGSLPGRIAEYKLTRSEAPVRFWVVAVVNVRDKVYAIRCDCAWQSRQIWREDFRELLQSVRLREVKSNEE
jgi:hypothetical protein